MTLVIAITGPPGSGKSTLCDFLCQHFQHSISISMDHYQLMTEWDPSQLSAWIKGGADYDLLPMPGLADALGVAIKRQNKIPGFQKGMRPLIFFESHLGKHTTDLALLVDYVVWIDCDLDICLARALLAMTPEPFRGHGDPLISPLEISHYLQNYLAFTASLLRIQRDRIRPSADYVYDSSDIHGLIHWIHAMAMQPPD